MANETLTQVGLLRGMCAECKRRDQELHPILSNLCLRCVREGDEEEAEDDETERRVETAFDQAFARIGRLRA